MYTKQPKTTTILQLAMNFTRYNAFCTEWGHGNPAAVVTLNEGRSYTDEMLKTIAQDMLCEVGFVLNPDTYESTGVVRMRYFTAARKEQKFIGHVTIAAMSLLGCQRDASLIVRCQGGDIPAKITGKFSSIEIAAPSHMHEHSIQFELLQKALGDIVLDSRMPTPVYTYGTSSRLMVFVSNIGAVDPNIGNIMELSNAARVSGVFVVEVSADGSSTRSRMFCPLIGVPEDACSGNAHGLMGFYLHQKGLLPSDHTFTGYQGDFVGRPSTVCVTVSPDKSTATVGGTVIPFCSGVIASSPDMLPPVTVASSSHKEALATQMQKHGSDNYFVGMF